MHRRHFLRSLALAPAAGLIHYPCGLVTEAIAQQRGGAPPVDPFKPSEGANNPVGVGQGIHPGRVAWVRDAKADQLGWHDGELVGGCLHRPKGGRSHDSRLLLDLTGRKNDKQAWDALFRNFNETRKLGNSGYRPGEKIAIKINANQDRGPDWAKWRVRLAGLGQRSRRQR